MEEVSTVDTPEVGETKKKDKNYNILYVDDERSNLRVFKSSFRQFYNVFIAETVSEAYDILANNDIQLIVTDQRMPEKTGTEFLESIIPDYPDIIRIILTGFSDIEAIKQAVNRCGIYKYITKPWDFGEMKMTLDKALETFRLKEERDSLNQQLSKANQELEDKVQERTIQLQSLNLELMESITFASKLQRSMLPSNKTMDNSFSDHFEVYQPRQVVSGDFYWAGTFEMRGQSYAFASLIECKGNGLIGSMLSMVSNSLLNDIVLSRKVFDPSDILYFLTEGIKGLIHTDDNILKNVSATVLVADYFKGNVSFSALNHRLLYVQNMEPKILEGDKIDFSVNNTTNFKKHTIDLNQPLSFYLSGSGITKAISSTTLEPYGFDKMVELFVEHSEKTMTEQKNILVDSLQEWRGEAPAHEDVTVLGLKLLPKEN